MTNPTVLSVSSLDGRFPDGWEKKAMFYPTISDIMIIYSFYVL
jgi:hypothetical protein